MRATHLTDLPTLERTATCLALVVLYTQGWDKEYHDKTEIWSSKDFKPEILDRLRAKGYIKDVGKTDKVALLTESGEQYAAAYLYNLMGLDVR